MAETNHELKKIIELSKEIGLPPLSNFENVLTEEELLNFYDIYIKKDPSVAYLAGRNAGYEELVGKARDAFVEKDIQEAYRIGRKVGDEELVEKARDAFVEKDPSGAYWAGRNAADEKLVEKALDALAKNFDINPDLIKRLYQSG